MLANSEEVFFSDGYEVCEKFGLILEGMNINIKGKIFSSFISALSLCSNYGIS